MQRCPYIHEMKERLLGAPVDVENKEVTRAPLDRPLDPQENQVGTIVKVSSYPFSSSYNCNENSDVECNEIFYVKTLTSPRV
uniref:SFRICE_033834 n=1 Tax=Spodoptera frugiperda TaxID=7108 RepID=A0A2H1V4Y2_SPOFR